MNYKESTVESFTVEEKQKPVHQKPQPPMQKPIMNADEEKYKTVGKKIVHRKFGSGVIQKVNGDIITVLFEDGKCTKLSIKMCLKNGTL